MSGEDQVARTKFMAPRLKRLLLDRPRLRTKLAHILDYPLTIIHAGAGYGKSTALAAFLAGRREARIWYSVGELEANPYLFLLNLIYALRSANPRLGEASLKIIEEQRDRGLLDWEGVVDVLVNDLLDGFPEETFVVLDDYHWAARHPQVVEITERLVRELPQSIHLVLSTREQPPFRSLGRWRLKGEVLEVGRDDLAFAPAEIAQLFEQQYSCQLTREQVNALGERTEGWVIALEMVWHALQNGIPLERVWGEASKSLQSLFDFLAQEVLSRQGPDMVRFLLRTCVLETMDVPACDFVADTTESAEMLRKLETDGLFVVDVGDGEYRYHHLFHEFLRGQASHDRQQWKGHHLLAASYYLSGSRPASAISHYLAAGDFEKAAETLGASAEELIRLGRLETVIQWISMLPGDVLSRYPVLFIVRGDACRLASQFDEALHWYTRAETSYGAIGDRFGISRALRGRAMVFLDTVQPAEAETLLKRALKHLDRDQPWEKALLLRLMAENKTNLGEYTTAERLRRAAHRLLHEAMESELDVRLFLRTGRLSAAQLALERRLREETEDPGREPRSHRETPLLLSLIYAIIGEPQKAFETARAGLQLGTRLKSPFVEAVAYMRLGHARQLTARRGIEEAERYYRKALELTDSLRVERGRAEPLWGLTLLYGFSGDLRRAELVAEEGKALARRAGDQWMCGLIELSLGASYANAGESEKALDWLGRAFHTYADCGDTYGTVMTQFWQAMTYLRMERMDDFCATVDSFLEAVQTHSYDFVFTRRTIFGPRDPGMAVPLLLEANRRGIRPDYVSWLLTVLGLPKAESHPGYTLYIQTLGTFRVWRGQEEVSPREWQREKAKQLLELFLTHRRELMTREQIIDLLWPDLDSEAAGRDFKVALNALNNALEPQRPPRASSFYILRHGSAYGLNLSAGYWIDVEEFESLIAKARVLIDNRPEEAVELYREAMDLFKGEYLPECLYEDWSGAERERVLALYLRAASQYARLLAEAERFEDCIAVCERVVAKDPCWEEAYRLLMYCHFRQGRRPAAIRAFEKCQAILKNEMGVTPMPETTKLCQQIMELENPEAVSF